jgi:hypothetical protein
LGYNRALVASRDRYPWLHRVNQTTNMTTTCLPPSFPSLSLSFNPQRLLTFLARKMSQNTDDPDRDVRGLIRRMKSKLTLPRRRDTTEQEAVRELEEETFRENMITNLIRAYESIRDDGGVYFDYQGLHYN